jgi:hypothetical protein
VRYTRKLTSVESRVRLLMPRKKSRRVKTQSEQPTHAMRPLADSVAKRANSGTASNDHSTLPIANPATAVDATPAQNLFWACYRAGVDTMRLAFDMQSALVRQSFQVSPASLALQCQVACLAFITDFDRDPAWDRGCTHPA